MNKKQRKNSRYNPGFYFECSTCGKKYDPEPFRYLCPECSVTNNPQAPPRGILKILYDYERLSEKYHQDKLFDKLKEKDFVELLPIRSERNLSYLKVGKTPLYRIRTLKTSETEEIFKFELYLKDDSQNPTFSFKDRASDLVSAFAKENGISKIVTASTGNAGSSLAGICASQQQQAIIIIPAEAPKAKLIQSLMYGARVIPVIGNYDQAFDLSIAASEKFGWFNRNTAYNPLTIEGKKIVSFEIFQQLRKTL
ncbi:MAG: pyridoxal-phosphate dependent enzyme, partial [Candidatus Cloacimonetes bacterium]|nr:pyridoxal-phosphate dependent enzyme [Candidatus Cloacimonadota bacterium]